MIRFAAAVVIATPDASSIAPVPRSQLSRWPPMVTIPAAGSLPEHFGDYIARLALLDAGGREEQRHSHRFSA
jgi:hypothetical protein